MENIETLLAAVAQTQGFDDDDEPVVRTPSEVGLDNSEAPPVIRGDTSASQVIGDVRPSSVVDKLLPATTSFAAVGRVIGDGEKRKRGRPPKGQLAAKPPPPKRTKVEDEEEDVCFICFDGGSLVLCDRKGCPKAYHPACIKRDEAFFKSTARWNCGWHICSVCQKASHYMCYTCTYSLCKRCTKDTDFLLVRGNKGFCSTCMKMIMMIENKDQATNESVKVDFDDKFSWEYLFKMYWVLLKEKLSLTLTELMQAKNPWNGVTAVAFKLQLSNVHTAVSREVSTSCRSTVQLELNKPHVEINLIQNDGLKTEPSSHDNHVEKQNSEKGEHVSTYKEDSGKPNRHKVTDETIIDKATNEPAVEVATKEPCIVKDQNDSSIVKDTDKPLICKNTTEEEPDKPGIDSGQWASEELLEFVAHMKNGDTSPVSQFDAQTLLLNYIKRHNLRDPHRKSQIICDLRLKNLFGKPRVGHIEMLKLLEFHFLIKEDSQKSSFIPAGFVSSVSSDVEVDATPINNRKRRTRKKSEDKPPQNDLCGYAAIDVHNINMIYLRRNLMENLIGDHGTLKDKVIGSIVRIRISTNDQKPEVFRLVQVVGTSKAAEPYTIGDKTTDVMLEVLNLDKKEVVSIDAISNLEFTEDECRRLRQSIRCGLVKLFTVGEVQKKALALQSVRVNDWLEAEVMRLNHLRDRASEKGRKKELREYVDRIELLKSPEERQRRFSAVPEIHADPKMDPDYVSEEDTRVGDNDIRDENMKPSYSPYPRRGRERTSPNKKGKKEQSAEAHSRITEKTGVSGSNGLDKHMNQINTDSGRNDQVMRRPGLETSTATASTGNSPSSDNIETEKLWHYRDPNGRIQGPFAMMQLRKWSTTGLFPPDMRIWTNHEQYDSLLLTDALKGKLHGASDLSYKPCLNSLENGATGEIRVHESTNGISGDDKQTEAARPDSVGVSSDKNPGRPGADESGSSGWPQCWDLLKDSNSSADDVQERNLFPASGSGERNVASTDRGQGEKNSTELTQNTVTSALEFQNRTRNNDQAGPPCEEKLRSIIIDLGLNDMDSGPVSPLQPESRSPDSSKQAETNAAFTDRGYGEKNLTELTQNTVTSAPELQDRTRNNDRAGPPCEESLRAIIIDLGLNDMDSSPVSPPQPVSRSPDSIKQAEDPPCEENLSIEVDSGLNKMDSRPVSPPALRLPDLSKQSENIEVLDLPSPTPKTVAQQSVSADAPVQDTCILELLSPTRRPNNEYQQEDQATENRQSGFAIFPNSGPGWTTTSTLGISVQLPEVADEWCGFSPTPARPSTQEWDMGHVSASSSKPPEVMSENINLQPASTTPNWLTIMNEPIEFDALGEESISDLLAEVDAMESHQALPSPTSAIKFARELMEDCKDDCFSSIEEFSSAHGPRKSDAFSSTTDLQQTSQSSAQCKPIDTSPIDAFDFFKRSSAHSSASSEGETNAPVHSGEAGSEFHPPTSNNTGQDMVGLAMGSSPGSGPTDPGWGSVQGNINMVTVQGNVNLVLGGPTQGMANLGWGTNPGTGWASPNVSRSPRGGSLPWDGQRKYNGERFTSPREWGYQGRQPWGRQPYGGGGYSRPLPKGQRVCKFYESGRCKKGSFCDYLHQ